MSHDQLTDAGDQLTVVYTAANSIEANFLKSLLESFSIPTRVAGEHFASDVLALPLGYLTAPTVLTPARLAAQARSVIEDWEAKRRERPPEDPNLDNEPPTSETLSELEDQEFRQLWEDDPEALD